MGFRIGVFSLVQIVFFISWIIFLCFCDNYSKHISHQNIFLYLSYDATFSIYIGFKRVMVFYSYVFYLCVLKILWSKCALKNFIGILHYSITQNFFSTRSVPYYLTSKWMYLDTKWIYEHPFMSQVIWNGGSTIYFISNSCVPPETKSNQIYVIISYYVFYRIQHVMTFFLFLCFEILLIKHALFLCVCLMDVDVLK